MEASKAHRLAACMERARLAAGGDVTSGSDVYWHTRERCFEVARREGVRWADVVSIHDHDRHTSDLTVIAAVSEPYWSEVMHPDLLTAEVMGL